MTAAMHIRSMPESGLVVIACAETDLAGLVAALAEAARERDYAALALFFSPDYEAAALAAALQLDVPIPVQIGCSTAGEIGPFGIGDGGAVAMLFAAERFCCVADVVCRISEQGFDRGVAVASALVERLGELAGANFEKSSFALTLIDGLSAREEVIVSSFQAGLRSLPHIGGSAGDGLEFHQAFVIHDGAAYRDAAVLCLFHSRAPFRIFKSDHYAPTDVRLVVTECDAERRLVTEINGAPAAKEYAEITGLDSKALSPMSFAAHPLVVRIGGEHFCRSIRRLEAEGLSFFCAIDKGVVLTLAQSHDMAESIDRALTLLDEELGGTEMILGFDCVLRRVEAESRQDLYKIAEIYRRHNVVGFNTYGEQYKAMHVNQTFSGIAFGKAAREDGR